MGVIEPSMNPEQIRVFIVDFILEKVYEVDHSRRGSYSITYSPKTGGMRNEYTEPPFLSVEGEPVHRGEPVFGFNAWAETPEGAVKVVIIAVGEPKPTSLPAVNQVENLLRG